MSRLTVIIGARDAGRFIAEALGSVWSQSVPPDELIVVDDGSVDDTAAIAEAHDAIVIRQATTGPGGARNTGLRAATGDLIAFLDADDRWPHRSLELRLVLLDADPALDAAFGLVDEFLDDSVSPGVRVPRTGFAVPLAGSTIVRRSLAEAAGPFPETPVADWVGWWAGVRRLGAVERIVPEVVLERRLHDANNSLQANDGGATFLRIAREQRRSRMPKS